MFLSISLFVCFCSSVFGHDLGHYEVFSRENPSLALYGYSSEKACLVDSNRSEVYVSVQNVYTFERTHPVRLIYSKFSRVQTQACFFHNGRSYLFTRDLFTNATSIIRAQRER